MLRTVSVEGLFASLKEACEERHAMEEDIFFFDEEPFKELKEEMSL